MKGLLILIAIFIGLKILFSIGSSAAKAGKLEKKYGPEIARRIQRRQYWVGQTAVQLQDSLGRPQSVDRRVLKTKVVEVWKYRPMARNRFALKIKLEDGVVAGWDEKA